MHPLRLLSAGQPAWRMVLTILWLLGLWLGSGGLAPVLAADPTAARFATVWRIHGKVIAAPDAGPARALQQGDVVRVGERITALDGAEALLTTDDAGAIAVRPGASFVAERFAAEGKASDHVALRLLEGGLRLVTGWIGHINPRAYRVVTPTSTIGIRGTDHEPYVVTEALVPRLSQAAGTYDKVNRGGTTLEANGNTLDIDPGKVGFARQVNPIRTRALMTLVLPVLLDRVPDFYVPGQFEAELDALSAQADTHSRQQLEARRKPPAVCRAQDLAKTWLAQLDGAITRQDSAGILALFASDIVVQATVRGQDGQTTTLRLSRDDFATSSAAAVRSLSGYQHRRPSMEARPEQAGSCERLVVRSVVIEQGRQNGKAYRFESTEDYVLERQGDAWIAIEAKATPR